jgi:hypothetical protein
MAEHDYIADSVFDPHPLSMQRDGPTLSTVTQPVVMTVGLPPSEPSAFIADTTSIRS